MTDDVSHDELPRVLAPAHSETQQQQMTGSENGSISAQDDTIEDEGTSSSHSGDTYHPLSDSDSSTGYRVIEQLSESEDSLSNEPLLSGDDDIGIDDRGDPILFACGTQPLAIANDSGLFKVTKMRESFI